MPACVLDLKETGRPGGNEAGMTTEVVIKCDFLSSLIFYLLFMGGSVWGRD